MPTPDPVPGQLTIHRTSGEDEQSRQILCSIDGTYVGQLLYGGTLTRTIAAGDRTLTVNNTLVWKTVRFHVEPGDHVHFTVWNRAWGGSLMRMLLVFFGAAPLAVSVRRGLPAAGGRDPEGGTPDGPLDVSGRSASK